METKLLRTLFLKTNYENPTNCWLYTGDICPSTNYGRVQIDGIRQHVHRIAADIFLKLEKKPHLFVCHQCAHRNCWNPAHLYLGTNQDNQKDVWQDKCKQGHDLKIYGRSLPSTSKRYCALCHSNRAKINYLKRKTRLTAGKSEAGYPYR